MLSNFRLLCLSLLFLYGTTLFAAPATFFGHNNLILLSPATLSTVRYANAMGALEIVYTGDETFSVPYCSAVQIAPDKILTAYHCYYPNVKTMFNKNRLADEDSTTSYEWVPVGTSLRLYFSGDLISYDEHNTAIISGLLNGSQEDDWAILSLERPIDNNFLPANAFPATDTPVPTELSNLMLLAYPNGMPLSMSTECQAWPLPKNSKFWGHTCDSLTGSSGGILVDVVTGIIWGIHSRGPANNSLEYWRTNGYFESMEEFGQMRGCDASSMSSIDYQNCLLDRGLNQAIKTSNIVL